MIDFFSDGPRARASLKAWREILHPLQKSRCRYCGVKLRKEEGEVDHKIKPHVHGGKETPKNMQLLCSPCNSRKGKLTDAQFRQRFKSVLPATLQPAKPIPLSKFEAVAKTIAARKAKAARKRRNEDPFGLNW